MHTLHTQSGSLRVAIFDVDGTLVTDTIHRDKHNFILGQVVHRPDLMLTPEEWNSLSGLADEDAYQYISDKAARRSRGLDPFLPQSTYLSIARRYINTHIGHVRSRPGAHDIIHAAEALGLLLGVATNANWSETDQKLTATGLLKHFRFFSCLDGVLAPKPAPDLYLYGMRTASSLLGNDLTPSHVIAFEDTETGATAAMSAGCRVVLWPQEKRNSTPPEFLCGGAHTVVAYTAKDCIHYLHAAFHS